MVVEKGKSNWWDSNCSIGRVVGAIEKKQNESGRALGEWWESSEIVMHWGCKCVGWIMVQ